MKNRKNQRNDIVEGSVRKGALVVRHNNFIEARHKLTLQQNRLLLWLISQIKPEDKEFTNYQIGIMELAEAIGIEKNKNIYAEMQVITEQLIGKVVQTYNPETDELLQVSPISSARYRFGEGTIQLGFSEEMRPFLLELKRGNFTKILLEHAMRLKSVYAMRIYDLVKMEEFKRKPEIEIELGKLREILVIPDEKYKLFHNFKQRVLVIAQKEINKRTDLKVEYDFKKTGRRISHVIFKVSRQGADIPYLPDTVTDNTHKKLLRIGLGNKEAAQLIEQYKNDPDRIIFHLKSLETQVREGKDIKKPSGWLLAAINRDDRVQQPLKDLLQVEDRQKADVIKQRQITIKKMEQELVTIDETISQNARHYEKFRQQEIIRAIERLTPEKQEAIAKGFKKTLQSSMTKGVFQDYGWSCRLISKDVMDYLTNQNIIAPLPDKKQWLVAQKLQTEGELERFKLNIEDKIKKVRQLAKTS